MIAIKIKANLPREIRIAKSLFGNLPKLALQRLKEVIRQHKISVEGGDIRYLDNAWYITHSGLLRIAARRRCSGIHAQAVPEFSDAANRRYVFKATVYKSRQSPGFVGYGDADPTNVALVVRGAEMRVAETRAVNRALRKAYGIGICSVEEIGSNAEPIQGWNKLAPHPNNGSGDHRTLRDRLYQIVHRYRLDPNLVKAYASDSCGVKALRDATREQIENFVVRLADWAEKDLDALRCQLNSYMTQKEEAA